VATYFVVVFVTGWVFAQDVDMPSMNVHVNIMGMGFGLLDK